MIIIRLQGGLGNQLFQYALGRNLAIKHGVPLKLDIRWYEQFTDRQYELDKFCIEAEVASLKEIRQFIWPLPDRVRWALQFLNPHAVITEKDLSFQENVLRSGPNTYIEGTWQSEKYFKEIAKEIRQELQLSTKPSGKNAELLKEIAETNAISLHVRRGDYVLAQNQKFHGSVGLDYYQEAVALMAKKVDKPHFYIFSDDPAWTKENLKFEYPSTFVDHNPPSAPEQDINLMRSCKHHITANSTFSWWGAWLNENPDKIVVAPKTWFAGGNFNPDLVPESWLRV